MNLPHVIKLLFFELIFCFVFWCLFYTVDVFSIFLNIKLLEIIWLDILRHIYLLTYLNKLQFHQNLGVFYHEKTVLTIKNVVEFLLNFNS